MEFVAAELGNRARYARIIQIIQQHLIWPCFIRTLTRYSEPGQPRPHTEQTAHVRKSRFTFERGTAPGREHPRPRAEEPVHVQARYGTWPRTSPPTYETDGPRTKQGVHMRTIGHERGA